MERVGRKRRRLLKQIPQVETKKMGSEGAGKNILDGRSLARRLNIALKERVSGLSRPPGLAVILVGGDPASQVYVKRKGIVAHRLGFLHRQVDLPKDATMETILNAIDDLNQDEDIHGILVQLPLPDGLSSSTVMDRIAFEKDVDGFTTINSGLLAQGRPWMVPCTPVGIMRLLEDSKVDLSGLDAVVIGRSNIVGRPMAQLLEQANCTVTVCHSRTRNLSDIVAGADVVVAAVGRPAFVQKSWLKPGAVVIDVGINRLDDGRLIGDVCPTAMNADLRGITPVPGGVGPMTIAMLMANTFRAACRAQGVAL
jgi:methylenetetrahydrofolate dehydrogenase (NADP+)/methenyltetrahydrofolate cyclohydrolase